MKTALATMALIAFTNVAEAQQRQPRIDIDKCGSRDEIMGILTKDFNEVVQFTGVRSEIHLDQLWFNKDTQGYSFTRVNIKSNAMCIISSGKYGLLQEIVLPKPKDPSL